jgi:hypothetical protein
VEESGRDLFYANIPLFAWMDLRKHEKSEGIRPQVLQSNTGNREQNTFVSPYLLTIRLHNL